MLFTKKFTHNFINYSYNLNATLPKKRIKNNNFDKNNIIITDKKLSFNQNIINNKNDHLNESYLLNNNMIRKRENKGLISSTMTDFKKNSINIRNDLSWDYGLGKEQNIKSNKLNQNFILSNYLSERKQNSNDIDAEKFNDDIDDKDIDEIVDNLDLSFLNDDKKNNTVILNEKGFSEDSLSDIADDIIKTFQETENDDINVHEMIPSSSSNRELDGITSSTTDIQNNNDYHSQKKIIYKTKSTIKPTIVNNFFISSEQNQYKNNNLKKDINYNLFVVNKYNNNNKINTNSNIPTLITRTYKSPNILREDKNNMNQNILGENDNYSDFIEKKNNDNFNNNNLIKNKNINENIIPENNYNLNNNLIQQNNNAINNFNKNFYTNIDYQNNSKINVQKENNYIEENNNYDFNINEPNKIQNFDINYMNKIQNINNNQIYNLHSNINNNLKFSLKKNFNQIKIANSTLKELLSSSYKNFDNNNIKVHKNKFNFPINDFDKQYLLNNQVKNQRKKKADNNYNLLKNISLKEDDKKNNIEYTNNYNNNYFKNKSTNNDITNINEINKTNFLNNTLNLNKKNNNFPNIINQKNNIKNNNIMTKTKKHITFQLNNNIFIKFRKDDLITNSEITTENGEIYNYPKRDMNFYQKELKFIKPKSIIKSFLPKDIKINKDYILVESLQERQILPDLYDDFEEDDIKSLEKSLEKSVDKILH